MSAIQLPEHDVVGIRADNPGPFTLDGTNSWVVGREPAWLIDPGPALPEHLDAVAEEIDQRGGLGGVLLTHDHPDHADGVVDIVGTFSPVPVAAARGQLSRGVRVDMLLGDGGHWGPFEVLATPGHAPDHLSFLTDDGIAFTGDAVLGRGSVFISPEPGALAGYLKGLGRLRARRPRVLAPGHGPVVFDVDAKLAEYIEHRLERERRILEAIDAGSRSTDELLAAVWANLRPELREAAALTLAAHLDKLADESKLPRGVERSQ